MPLETSSSPSTKILNEKFLWYLSKEMCLVILPYLLIALIADVCSIMLHTNKSYYRVLSSALD
ncbi:hypothetical protein N7449_010165 [Penicillium cf. viridicatum]|uniref:Uncharacterized protein n=1 Tax=Penicillium cf. viridicatum TaxID=2972119 RepID=A0A9W9J3Y1_9EURO|nr:hypothetical protein N7449_010165 [Penicillium cf. viridicatum]